MPKSANSTASSELQEYNRRKAVLFIGCRYDVILRLSIENGFRVVREGENWSLLWSDSPLSMEKIMDMKHNQSLGGPGSPSVQKINHFPGMYEVCRKDRLARNLNRMKRLFPRHYDFFPQTWDLPSEVNELLDYGKKHRNATYIVKPDAGCQGRGIFLIRNLKLLCPFAKCVCQLYVTEPFLIDGYKYDQRMYVLITCVDPLRIYIYQEGIARFATVKYQPPNDCNLEVTYMHLTNYSLNKYSDAFDDDLNGTKRLLSEVYEWMTEHGCDVQKLKNAIDDIVIKTIVCIAPTLRHNYRTTFPKKDNGSYCFELLGFDILITSDLKPVLIEVNHSPSYNLDTLVDQKIKCTMVRDLFRILYFGEASNGNLREVFAGPQNFSIRRRPGTPQSVGIPNRLKDQFAYEETNLQNFRLIFAEDDPGKYGVYLDKEYFLEMDSKPDHMYIKTRLEPFLEKRTRSKSKKSKNTSAAIVSTKDGQKYVEYQHVSPFLNSPKDCLVYKSIKSKSKPKSNSRGYRHRHDHSIAEVCKAMLPDINGMHEGQDFYCGIGECEERLPILPLPEDSNPRPVVDRTLQKLSLASSKSKGKEDLRLPSQRVHAALERLRQKNMEQIKTVAEQTREKVQKATARARKGEASMSISHYENEQNNNIAPTDTSRLRPMDITKLPSIFKQLRNKEFHQHVEDSCDTEGAE